MQVTSELESLLKEIDVDFDPPLSSSTNLAEYAKKIYENATIFSVHEDGKLVAAAAVYCNHPDRQTAFVTMLAVVAGHRSHGLGSNLIKTTIAYLSKRSFKFLKLEIYKTNLKAIQFYKNLDFVLVGETDSSVFVELVLL